MNGVKMYSSTVELAETADFNAAFNQAFEKYNSTKLDSHLAI